MIKKLSFAFALCSSFLSCKAAHAQPNMPPRVAISAEERLDVTRELGKLLRENYIFPEVAEKVSGEIVSKAERDGYVVYSTVGDFAGSLTYDLSHLGKDRHFQVMYNPDFKPDPVDGLSDEEAARQRKDTVREGYGIAKLERLPGNVGYLNLRSFEPSVFVGQAYSNALSLLAGTDALILDLRSNMGGDPDSVVLLLSHFFKPGDQRHLSDIVSRKNNETQQFWTIPSIGERYAGPVYALTSPRTFSAGEACAYDLQTQKRGIVVGETTSGGANAGDWFVAGHGFVVFIPTGRTVDSVTHGNWEGVGVKPDTAAPAAMAFQLAYADILKKLIAKNDDPDERQELKAILSHVEKGESEQPNYSPPH